MNKNMQRPPTPLRAPSPRQKMETVQTSRTRTHKMFIDSRDHVSHVNNNPSNYTYVLNDTIPNVTKIRLLSFRVPYSPTFVIIRSSDWMAAGTPLNALDEVHQLAVILNDAIRIKSVELSSIVATLYKSDGTVSLNIVQVFTFTSNESTDPASRFRTYDVFICTGTILTTAQDNWRIQFPACDDADLSDLGMTDDTNSTIAINVLEENLYLTLDIGGNQGRLNSVRTVYPEWKSFQVYRRPDTISKDGTCYVCLVDHMSLIFSDDLLANYWTSIPAAKMENGPADRAFYVVETNEPNESIIIASANHDEIVLDVAPTDVSRITLNWNTRRGSHYLFPQSTAIDFLSFTVLPPALLKKEYRFHTLMIELEYQEITQVHVPAGHTSGQLAPTPNFLMPSSGAYGAGPLRGIF